LESCTCVGDADPFKEVEGVAALDTGLGEIIEVVAPGHE